MNKIFTFFSLLCSLLSFAQIDFSNNWEDFYSYNNVKDFTLVENKIYAIVDNALFIYDLDSEQVDKISSVHGLSGESTASIYYSSAYKKTVIGYQTGLVEFINENNSITIANDIERLGIVGNKQINSITEHAGKLYFSTPFAIVVYNLENNQFGDTYFIGNNSTEVKINEIVVHNNTIYAATEQGVFTANVADPNLIDYNNWQQPTGNLMGNYTSICIYNNNVFASKENTLYQILNNNAVTAVSYSENIKSVKSSTDYLTVSLSKSVEALDENFNKKAIYTTNEDFDFSINTALTSQNHNYIATKEFGILFSDINSKVYSEIHPEGPASNDVFSITTKNNNLWVVYGGYDAAYTPLQKLRPFSHFNGESWKTFPAKDVYPFRDLVHVTIHPDDDNSAYISSWGQTDAGNLESTGGLLVVNNNEISQFLNHTNSGLESVKITNSSNYRSVRINGTAFDRDGNLWVTNGFVDNKLKKLSPDGNWFSYDLSSVFTNKALGLSELIVDKRNTVWIGSRRNGLIAFNENGAQKRALTVEVSKGSLPDPNVRSVIADRNNRIWIGTQKGLVVFKNSLAVFESENIDALPVIIEDDGIARKLLGNQPVNTIAVDGADNKWFGTDTGGVLGTNASGQETLFNFNKNNSPLPSNRILKIKVDASNGKVYFATDKGIVAFKSNVAPFGDKLDEVYAYPNPVLKNHKTVTIDGRNGKHIPRGTNVKILDAAGRLVYETNVIEGQELKGGKVVWNKTNLAGKKVASGIYIVLLSVPDEPEASSTKIAIIN